MLITLSMLLSCSWDTHGKGNSMMVHGSTWFQYLMLHLLCGGSSDSLVHDDDDDDDDDVISIDKVGRYGFFVCTL